MAGETPENFGATLRTLLSYLKPHRVSISLVVIGILVARAINTIGS